MSNFEKWDKAFRAQDLFSFNYNATGLLWLKVRAVCRGKQLQRFLNCNHIVLSSTKLSERNKELFEKLETMPDALQRLDDFLRIKSHDWYVSMGVDESKLKEDLYKVHHYAWGGDQNNSLDKHLVSKYVKVISSYDCLISKQAEISENAWNYVQTSWYNNWTSYLIEALFKRHERVISAVGEIKSVDFFIDDYPIDLKVTSFPNQYMEERLKEKLGKKELTWLRQKAKEANVTVDSSFSEKQQMYALYAKLGEIGRTDILEELAVRRKEIVMEAQQAPLALVEWLYTHQGEMRFGAENRLFVILVDTTDMNQSWAMKRAFSLIEPKVKSYLDSFTPCSLKEVSFTFKGDSYKSLADILFVIKKD